MLNSTIKTIEKYSDSHNTDKILHTVKLSELADVELYFEGVIFDFDGTLVDSMSIWEDIDREFFLQQKIEMPQGYLESITALSYKETAEHILKTYNLKMTLDEIFAYFNDIAKDQYLKSVKCKPGALEFVDTLRHRNIKMTIATSLCPELLEAGLKGSGLDEYFIDKANHCDTYNTNKLDNKIFKIAASSIDVDPKNCLLFEDIVPAIKSAKSLGMTTFGVVDTHSHQDRQEIHSCADFIIESYDEISFEATYLKI